MDSGPAHMAAAVDTPVVVFSPHPRTGDPMDTHSPVRFRPWGRAESVVLQPEHGVWPCTDRCRGEAANCLFAIADEDAAQAIRGVAERAWKQRARVHAQNGLPGPAPAHPAGKEDIRAWLQ